MQLKEINRRQFIALGISTIGFVFADRVFAQDPDINPTPTAENPADAAAVVTASDTETHYATRMTTENGVGLGAYDPDILAYKTSDGRVIVDTEDQPFYERIATAESNAGTRLNFYVGSRETPDPRGNLRGNPDAAANEAEFVETNWPVLKGIKFEFYFYNAADVTDGNNIPNGATEIDRYFLGYSAFSVDRIKTPDGLVFKITMNTRLNENITDPEQFSYNTLTTVNCILDEIAQNIERETKGLDTNWNLPLRDDKNGGYVSDDKTMDSNRNMKKFFTPDGQDKPDFGRMWLTSKQ